jgi:hypothetical protein
MRPTITGGLASIPASELNRKPWMHQRRGETRLEFHTRLARTCYRCGREDESLAASAAHEDECQGAPRG